MLRKILKKPLSKINEYEFWSFYKFYAPFTPLYLYYSLKLKSLCYFSLCNPNLKYGGFIEYSKSNVLKPIRTEYKPISKVIHFAEEEPLPYPFIAKPDVGERGIGVELIKNPTDWNNYLKNAKFPLELQEYIDLPLEYGIFYYKLPTSEKGDILGITGKEFLTVIGDGKKSLKELIEAQKRANNRQEYLFNKFKAQLSEVIPESSSIVLEEIGNHSRGTYFFDASHLITPKLKEVMNDLANDLEQFHYGRWDVKTKSEEDFKNGKFVIIEINGTNSEATHIYDKRYNLYDAYNEVYKKLKIQYRIAKENKAKGFKPQSSWSLGKDIIRHLCFQKT